MGQPSRNSIAPRQLRAMPTFPYGVASGDVSHMRVVLWTKTAPGVDVAWWCEQVGGRSAHTGDATGDATTGSVHVPVTGLAPGQQYRYRFTSGGDASTEGQFQHHPDRSRR